MDSLENAVKEILTFLTSEKDCKVGHSWKGIGRDTDRIERINDVERTERERERQLFTRVSAPAEGRSEREAGQDSDDGEISALSGGWVEKHRAAQLGEGELCGCHLARSCLAVENKKNTHTHTHAHT